MRNKLKIKTSKLDRQFFIDKIIQILSSFCELIKLFVLNLNLRLHFSLQKIDNYKSYQYKIQINPFLKIGNC